MSITQLLLKGLGGELVNPDQEIRSLLGPNLGGTRATAWENLGQQQQPSGFRDVRQQLKTPEYAEAVRDVEPSIRRQMGEMPGDFSRLEELLNALHSGDARLTAQAESELRDIFLRGMGVDPNDPGIFRANQYGEFGDIPNRTQPEGMADTGIDEAGGTSSGVVDVEDLEAGATHAEALDIEADEAYINQLFDEAEPNFAQQMEMQAGGTDAEPETPWQEGLVALRHGQDVPESAFAGYGRHEGGGRTLADLQSARVGGFKMEDDLGNMTGVSEEFANLGEGQLPGLMSHIRRQQPAAQHGTPQYFDEPTEQAFMGSLGERGKFLHPNQMQPEDLMQVVDDMAAQFTGGKKLSELTPEELFRLNQSPQYNDALEQVFVGSKGGVRAGREVFEDTPYMQRVQEGISEWGGKMTPETQKAQMQRQFNIERWADEPGGLTSLMRAAMAAKSGMTQQDVMQIKQIYDSFTPEQAQEALGEFLQNSDQLAGLLRLRQKPEELAAAREALVNPGHPNHQAYMADFSKKWIWRQMAPQIDALIGDKMGATTVGAKNFNLEEIMRGAAQRGEAVQNPQTGEIVRQYDPRAVGKTNLEAFGAEGVAQREQNALLNMAHSDNPDIADLQQHIQISGQRAEINPQADFDYFTPPTGDEMYDIPSGLATGQGHGRFARIPQSQPLQITEEQSQLINAIREVAQLAEPRVARGANVDVQTSERPRVYVYRNDKTGQLGVSTTQPDIPAHTSRSIAKSEKQLGRRLSRTEKRGRQQFMHERAYAPKQITTNDLYEMSVPELRKLWKRIYATMDQQPAPPAREIEPSAARVDQLRAQGMSDEDILKLLANE